MTVRAETEVTLTRVNDGDNGVKVYDGTAGSVVTVSNASAYPALELVADIIPIQEGSGTPAPDNIRPIYGHDHCTITRTGKNLVDTTNATSGLCGYHAGDTLDTVVASTRYSHSVPIRATDGLAISFKSADVTTFNQVIAECFVGNNWVASKQNGTVSNTTTTITIIVPANTYDWVRVLYSAPASGTVGTNIDGEVQVEIGSTATTFEPYKGIEYTINFPQIVYKGNLDVVKGILTVTYDNIASYNGETLNGEWISDRDVYVSGTTPTTGAQVVYEVDTPTVYSVSPKDIELITGTCNVWATTGDITDFRYAEISNDTLTVLDKVNADIKKTSQYFWHEQTGPEAGAHITEIPQEEFEANPSGGNLLATSNGIVVRDGLSDTAVYSADGIILYAPNNVLGFQIATTGGTSEQSVLRVRNIYYPSGTITDTISQLSSIPASTEIEWRWASTRMSLDGTLTFTRGTSATETVSFTLTQTATVVYDGVATFTITNNSGIEDFRNVSVRYEYVTTTPEIKVKDAVLTNGTWYCESKVLLWTNPDPSSDWSGDLTSPDIDLDILALCDEVEIYYYFSTSDRFVYSQRCNVYHGGAQSGYKTRLSIVNLSSNRCGGRDVTLVSDTSGFTINSGFYNGSQNNAYAIPWKIIGIRHI